MKKLALLSSIAVLGIGLAGTALADTPFQGSIVNTSPTSITLNQSKSVITAKDHVPTSVAANTPATIVVQGDARVTYTNANDSQICVFTFEDGMSPSAAGTGGTICSVSGTSLHVAFDG